MSPKAAAEDAIRRIVRRYPDYVGAVFAVAKDGQHAGACHGWTFTYAVRDATMDKATVYTVHPIGDESEATA
jgi:N4-(beta-N-acetylglucosaminyl)-L-asparaginase